MNDISLPKGQAVVDRLRRRLEKYRSHHDEAIPRFQETINGHNEQHKQETLLLRQRYLESNKAKKSAKKSEKNKSTPTTTGQDSSSSSTPGTASNKMLKRPCEDVDMLSGSGNGSESFEPLAKVPFGGSNCNGKQSSILQNHHSLNSSGNNSLQNSNVKNLNSSVKSGSCSSPGATIRSQSPHSMPTPCSSSTTNSTSYASSNVINIEMKQEPSAFADLDQCAAALEKDAANSNGSIISGLIGLDDAAPDGLIPSDTLKDLISEISDLNPDFMGDFDFEEDRSDVLAGISRSNGNPMNSNHNPNQTSNDAISSSYSNHTHCHATPVAPVTPTASSNTSSPRLSHVKLECETSSSGRPNSVESSSGNGGLSHCAGPSPAAASTASPLASQLNAHHPSQTPPYCSGSAMFDSSPPTQQTHSTSGSSTPNSNYGPQSATSSSNSGMANKNSGTRIPYTSPSSGIHDSPAAQTLKQMAEQHQHKSQLGIGSFKTPQGSNPSPARSPFNGDSYGQQLYNCPSSDFNMNNTSANGSNFSNARPPGSASGNDPMNGVTIKQEVPFNSGPSSVSNFQNMDHVNKRLQQQQHPPQEHSVSHHKPQGGMLPGLLNPSNNIRMPHPNNNSNVHPPSQQPPSTSKSFNHTGNSVGHAVHNNTNMHPGQMVNPHSQHFGNNRTPNPGMIPNNFGSTNHSGYNPVNHPSVKMSQSQPMNINQQSNSSVSLPTTGSQAQQMGMGSAEMKPNMINMSQANNMSYYQNVPHSQSMQQQMSHGEPNVSYMNSSSCTAPSQTQHQSMSNLSNQGQTINFTQQHLRMATGVSSAGAGQGNLTRMMSGPPGVQGSGQLNPRLAIPPRMQTNQGMNEIPPRPSQMEMQHRLMMRQQQIRGPSTMQQPQQMGMMIRSHCPDYKADLPGAQQIMGQNTNHNALMNRFNVGASGPGRPSMMSGPTQMGHRMNQQHNSMYNHQQLQQGINQAGCNPTMNMNGGAGHHNMSARRVPFNPNSGPMSSPMVPFRGPANASSMLNNGAQQGQPSMGMMSNGGPGQDWQMQDPSGMRNFAGMQQQIRTNQNPSNFHPGMAQQQGQHSMNQVGNIPQGGMGGQNQLTYNQQQHMSAHGNTFPSHMKMGHPPCSSSNNFPTKSGGMCPSNPNSVNQPHNSIDNVQMNHSNHQQSLQTQQHVMKSEIQSDFNFDLLENISSGDNSSFGNDGSDYMNSFDSTTNYQHILDTL